jgi:mRNA deadenylase 3'-5' endonuclease subunit Ccr4/GTPase SAR1 family protein
LPGKKQVMSYQWRWLTDASFDSGFVLVTYNILADIYAAEGTQKMMEGRLEQVYADLCVVEADVFCLQEVEPTSFEWLREALGASWSCMYAPSEGGDGCAVCFKRHVFDLIEYECVNFPSLAEKHGKKHEEGLVRNAIEEVCWDVIRNILHHSVAQIVALKDIHSGRTVIMANTHLYWGPGVKERHRQTQFVQVWLLLHQMHAVQQKLNVAINGFVLCGDLNCGGEEDSDLLPLLEGQVVLGDSATLLGLRSLPVDGPLHSPLPALKSFHPASHGTYFGKDFSRKLDWILASSHSLTSTQLLEYSVPTTSIPDETHPSDHTMVGARFAWSNRSWFNFSVLRCRHVKDGNEGDDNDDEGVIETVCTRDWEARLVVFSGWVDVKLVDIVVVDLSEESMRDKNTVFAVVKRLVEGKLPPVVVKLAGSRRKSDSLMREIFAESGIRVEEWFSAKETDDSVLRYVANYLVYMEKKARFAWQASIRRPVMYSRKVTLAFIGPIGTGGKTVLIHRLLTNSFNLHFKATIGYEFKNYQCVVDNCNTLCKGDRIYAKCRLLDVGFKEIEQRVLFSRMSSLVDGYLLSFDSTLKWSFADAQKWMDLVHECKPTAPVVLIGNKCDLSGAKISEEEIAQFIARYPQIRAWFWTSTVTGLNVRESVASLVRYVCERSCFANRLICWNGEFTALCARRAVLTLLLIKKFGRPRTLIHWLPKDVLLIVARKVFESRKDVQGWERCCCRRLNLE